MKLISNNNVFTVCFILSLLIIAPDYSFGQKFSFDNMNIGIGINSSDVNIVIPEIPEFSNYDTKGSLLVDFRFNFKTFFGLRFAPGVAFWSWGEFPEDPSSGAKVSLENLSINLDVHYRLNKNKKISPYFGAGPSFQSISITNSFAKSVQPNPGNILRIDENYFYPGLNFACGLDYRLNTDYYINLELRREISRKVDQWKFAAHISLF